MRSLILIMSVMGIFLIVLAVGMPFLMADSNRSRLKAVRARRENLRKELQASQVKTVSLRDKLGKKSKTQKIAEKINISKLVNMDNLKNKLNAAGWRGPDTPQKYLLALIFVPVFFGLYASYMVYGPLSASVTGILRPVSVLFATLLGFGIPPLLLKNAATKRTKSLTKQFPDALDLMLVCVEAGLSVEQSFFRITEEIGDVIPEIGEEFALTGAELAFLGDKRQAYDNMTSRTGSGEFKSLSTTLIQSEKYGTPVGSALRVLSDEARKNRTNAVEKKAAGLGPKMTIPMILFILPCLFMIVIGPAAISIKMQN